MRKINHINLGSFLSNSIDDYNLLRKSFVVGNVLPDCIPSFIYVRHNLESTFEKVKKILKQLMNIPMNTYKFWIKLGCIIHYIADYFTYPHTKLFHDGFFKHNKYEKYLKIYFNENLNKLKSIKVIKLNNMKEIISYIKEQQEKYFKDKINNKENSYDIDTTYIFKVTKNIVFNILNIKKSVNY